MRILFYIAHPAKFHLFKYSINEIRKNYLVHIIINSKDVLEDLIKSEGWEYTNLFPKGRNISNKPSVIYSALKFLITLYRLEKYLFMHKKYDVFVTDDSLVVNGWCRRIPSYIFNDNDIETIKINKILFYFAYRIISPNSTNLGTFTKKKISFVGNKAIAHLHPHYFKPKMKTLTKYNLSENKYCVIRVAKLNATHDIDGNTGITDTDLESIISIIDNKFRMVIVSERKIPVHLQKFIYTGNPIDISDILNFAIFVISDSGTMATEAAMLGVPNILINKLAKNIGVHKELKNAGLQHYFDQFNDSLSIIDDFVNDVKIKQKWFTNKINYFEKCDDLNKTFIEIFTNKSRI